MEQGLAIMEAAEETKSPVILQASRGARAYANDVVLAQADRRGWSKSTRHPGLHASRPRQQRSHLRHRDPVRLHLGDDGRLAEGRRQVTGRLRLHSGITKRVVDMAHWGGVSVEGEIGVLGSLESGGGEQEDGHGVEGAISHDQLLTDPEQAVEFVKDTHVDALAVAMGTSHGAYKFSRKPDGAVLAMNVIEDIHRRLPNMHLVMHGSSSVPEDLQEIINKYGGQMKPTWGVPVEEIQRGIKHGVRKITSTPTTHGADRRDPQGLTENPSEFDPRKYLTRQCGDAQALQGALRAVRHAGNAPKIKPLPVSEMAKRYKSGSLDPKFG